MGTKLVQHNTMQHKNNTTQQEYNKTQQKYIQRKLWQQE